jgi:shikimate kinase
LQSQFDTLEPLEEDETGRVFDVTRPVEEIAKDATAWIKAGS